MKPWRKRLEAFRDEHLRRESPAALAEEEARPDPSAVMREIEGLTLRQLEERRREALTKERGLIDALRQMTYKATYEAGIDRTKIGRHNFLSALLHPIVVNAWRLEVQQLLKQQRKG